ncbi:amino acid deaminase/aldolase [Allonocardiopsis opalescens]|nr:amino acid deaminase/aldolase [Allonocardiopsis opalescens]
MEPLRDRYDRATAGIEPPFAAVDLAAFRANAADLVRRAAGKPVRVASKSVRCRALLTDVLAMDGFAGVLAFTLPEALWLVAEGVTDDVLLAYPTADATALRTLADDPRAAAAITVTVDCTDHLDLLERAAAGSAHTAPLRVCLDVDTGWLPLGGRVRVGALRSPVRTPAQAVRLAQEVVRRPRLRLVGLLAYEAQIAGVPDRPPGRPLYGGLVRFAQHRSRVELARRRAEIVRAVGKVAELEYVNGGGTGNLGTAARERALTEVAAGSGLYAPTLFDGYRAFTPVPAAAFALPVVRRPGPGTATVLGGGYLASGTAAPDRLPRPWLPSGLHLTAAEGAGEVQTPVVGPTADTLRIGDRVWFRHAKAGELCERFDRLHLIDGERVVRTVPTYRGEGRTFL